MFDPVAPPVGFVIVATGIRRSRTTSRHWSVCVAECTHPARRSPHPSWSRGRRCGGLPRSVCRQWPGWLPWWPSLCVAYHTCRCVTAGRPANEKLNLGGAPFKPAVGSPARELLLTTDYWLLTTVSHNFAVRMPL